MPNGAKAKAKAGRTKKKKEEQLALPIPKRPGRGGRRPGAGRKPATPSARPRVAHRRRPDHGPRCPVHVTMRVGSAIPSLRCQVIRALLKSILEKQVVRDYGPWFQVVHYSIQNDHIHLVVEAQPPTSEAIAKYPRLLSKRAARGLETSSRDMLRRGIAGLAISFAMRLNALLGRSGAVFSDRHHRRDLVTPNEVRNALNYVLQNHVHHGARVFGVGTTDPYSTGPCFGGWAEPHATWSLEIHWTPRPRTWLLLRGWLRAGGPISTTHGPALSPHAKVAPEVRDYRPVHDPRPLADVLRELQV